ncbi:hypothetical protein Tco_1417104, partial [Tanacetum coccineum]
LDLELASNPLISSLGSNPPSHGSPAWLLVVRCDDEGLLCASPFKQLERKTVKQNNRMVIYGLIQWSNGEPEDATWEKLEDIISRFPEFVLDP